MADKPAAARAADAEKEGRGLGPALQIISPHSARLGPLLVFASGAGLSVQLLEPSPFYSGLAVVCSFVSISSLAELPFRIASNDHGDISGRKLRY